MSILVVDVGGNNVKLLVSGASDPRKFPSGRDFSPEELVRNIRAQTADWVFDRVTLGFPGPIRDGKISREPVNLGRGWVHFDFSAALEKPIKIINDATMQAIGSYQGGRMLFLGLGTGLGSTMIVDSVVVPMELGHLPYRKSRSIEDYVGDRGLRRLGARRWRKAVFDAVARLQAALMPDYTVLGGGNVKRLPKLPIGTQQGSNRNAFLGGIRIWEENHHFVLS
jgi:polyphosphate glucokinase